MTPREHAICITFLVLSEHAREDVINGVRQGDSVYENMAMDYIDDIVDNGRCDVFLVEEYVKEHSENLFIMLGAEDTRKRQPIKRAAWWDAL